MIKTILPFFVGLMLISVSVANAQEKQFQSAFDLSVKGANFFVDEDYEKAFDAFREVNYNDTAYYDLTLMAISCANRMNRFDTVLTICNEVLGDPRYNPNRESFMVSKSHALLQKDKDEEGLNFLNESLIEFPRSAILRYNKSVVQYRMEQYDDAITSLQEAIRYNPRHVLSHLKLGLICSESGNLAKAALCLNMVVYLGAGDENALGYIGLLERVYYNTVETNIGNVNFRENEDFDEIDDLIRNRTALQKGYKVPGKLQFDFVKANHLLFDQIQFDEESDGFWNETYVRFFKDIYKKGEFVNYSLFQALRIDDAKTQKEIVKNKSKVISFLTWAGDDFAVCMNDRRVWNGTGYEDNTYNHYGKYGFNYIAKTTGDKITGPYKRFYDSGIMESEGNFNNDGFQDGVWKFYDEDGRLTTEATFVKDKLSGLRTSYYENGSRKEQFSIIDNAIDGDVRIYTVYNQLQRETKYVKGKETGESKSYYNTGELYSKITVKNDLREGPSFEYYPDGQVMTEASYVAGELSGAYVNYHRNGEIRTKGQYVDDLREGHWEYRYKNKQLREEGDYKGGYRIGLWKIYSLNGKLSEETNYGETGKKIGVYKEYDLDENLILELTYKGEEIISYRTFDGTGKVLSEGEKKRKELEFENYYSNGVLQTKGNYFNGNRVGVWKFYNQYGVIETDENHTENGDLNGDSHHYFDNGQIETVIPYKDGMRDGYYVDYYRNGQMFTDGFYVEDEQQGAWNYYYRDGKLKSTEFYSEGSLFGDVHYYDEKGRLREKSTYFYGNLERVQTFDTTGMVLKDYKIIDGKLTNAEFTDVAGNLTTKKSYDGGAVNGEVIGYYKNGNIRSKGMNIDGSQHGKWEWFYENGKQQTVGSFEFGKRSGEWKWFHENGQLDVVTTYVDGDIEGKYIAYYENGKMEVDKVYRADEMHGACTYYDESGEVQLIRYYSDGRLLGYSYLGADKKPVAMIPFDNQNGAIEAFYYNGKKSYYSERKDGYLQGKTIEYHFNGKEGYVWNYEKGQEDGVQKEYYANGNLKEEAMYSDGGLNGTLKKYHENGKVKLVESYISGVLYGWSTSYKSDGSVEKRRYYYGGNEL